MTNNVVTHEKRPAREQSLDQPRRGWLHPQVNITETKEAYLLEAEMPGVGKDGLEILLEGSELTIIGRREPDLDNAQVVYRESSNSDYRRSFELDPSIDTGRITARMEDGVLILELPKAEKVKPRKIRVD
jgi:HSP20 family protein